MLWYPKDELILDQKKRTVILCIDPDSDSDIVIEEGEGDFRERCIIIKGEEQDVEEEAEQADDEQSEPLTTAETEPGTSLTAEQETEDKDETISSTSTQDFDREKVEREFINLASHYQQIGESFKKLVEEVPHMKKCQLATHFAKMPILPMVKVTTEEKVSSMYNVMKKNLVKYRKNMIQKYMERVWRRSYRALLTALESSPHYF